MVLIFAYLVPAMFISLMLTDNPLPMLGLGSTMALSTAAGLLLVISTAISHDLLTGCSAYHRKKSAPSA